VLLIGGGVGVTVVRSLFESLPGRPGTVTVIYRASREQDLVLRDELDAIASARGSRVHYVTGRRHEWRGVQPLSPQHLKQLVPDVAHHDVYLCGPPGMQEAVVESLRVAGVPRRHIHTEDFAFEGATS
jgi:NAD(P)H-flavin reductase